MKKPTLQLLRDIRSKYVGTADEHDALALVIEEEGKGWDRLQAEHVEYVQAEREVIEADREQARLANHAGPLDDAVFRLLRTEADKEEETWVDSATKDLVFCCKARGLTRQHLERVLAKWEDVE